MDREGVRCARHRDEVDGQRYTLADQSRPVLIISLHSSLQLGAFLPPLDMCTDFGLCHLVYDLRHARKSVDD